MDAAVARDDNSGVRLLAFLMGCNIKPPVACSPSLPRDGGSRDPSAAPPPCAERPSGTAAPVRTSSCVVELPRAVTPAVTPDGARALRRLLCAPRRTTGPFAEQWCVLGTFPLKPKQGWPLEHALPRSPLPDGGTVPRRRQGAVRGEHIGTSALASRGPLRRPRPLRQSPSIHLDLAALQTRRPWPGFN